ncbi:MAG: zf-HC2 domain-containing protein [Candidatus Omnitrophota bacterium]|nr:zf-HC2 domain-containing protein [Candidatus Omnitrophota bacterium]
MKRKRDAIDSLFINYFKHKYGEEKELPRGGVEHIKSGVEIKSPLDLIPKEKKTTCPPDVKLGAYINNVLKGNEKAALEKHLSTCPGCKDKVESGREIVEKFEEGKLPNVPDSISFPISDLKKTSRK